MDADEIARGVVDESATVDPVLRELFRGVRERTADAIRAAVAAERARWVAACWAAFNEGYSEQGWTVLHQMGATKEVPK